MTTPADRRVVSRSAEIATAADEIARHLEHRLQAAGYDRTLLVLGAMLAVERFAEPLQGPARQAVAEEACQLWARLGAKGKVL